MSFIYVAETGKGYCKIGKSDDPRVRVRNISYLTGLKFTKLKFFECEHDAYYAESLCHEELRQYNSFLEFFNVDFDDACLIAERNANAKKEEVVTSGNKRIPYSLRLNPDVYEVIKREADRRGVKMNWLLNHILCKEAERLQNEL